MRWYNSKDVVPTLKAMQKMIAFYREKGIDKLKLGCILSNLANTCLHKSTDAKFYPFAEGDENFLEKIRENFVGGPSIVSTHKAVVDELLFESLHTYANRLLGFLPANYITPRCVNPCLPDFIRVGISIQRRLDLHSTK